MSSELLSSPPRVRFGPRLCEKSHRQKKRRIVFFVVFCDGSCLHCSFSNPTKSRRKFQIKIELPTFHTAWATTGLMHRSKYKPIDYLARFCFIRSPCRRG